VTLLTEHFCGEAQEGFDDATAKHNPERYPICLCLFPSGAGSQKQNFREAFRLAMLTAPAFVAFLQGPAMARDGETSAPLVWFAPQSPGIWPDGRTGVLDFMDLFTPSAPWSNAAPYIKVFKIANSEFLGNLPGALTDSQWRQVFADLGRRGIDLAIEWGPLTPEGCGAGMEGSKALWRWRWQTRSRCLAATSDTSPWRSLSRAHLWRSKPTHVIGRRGRPRQMPCARSHR
jgi:hypothetical protein